MWRLKRSDVLVTEGFLVSRLTGRRLEEGTVEGQVMGVNECMGVCCCVCILVCGKTWSAVGVIMFALQSP